MCIEMTQEDSLAAVQAETCFRKRTHVRFRQCNVLHL
jgi:hypothetical protein